MDGDKKRMVIVGHIGGHGKSLLAAAVAAAAAMMKMDAALRHVKDYPDVLTCEEVPPLVTFREIPRDHGRRYHVIEPKGNRKQRRRYRKQNR